MDSRQGNASKGIFPCLLPTLANVWRSQETNMPQSLPEKQTEHTPLAISCSSLSLCEKTHTKQDASGDYLPCATLEEGRAKTLPCRPQIYLGYPLHLRGQVNFTIVAPCWINAPTPLTKRPTKSHLGGRGWSNPRERRQRTEAKTWPSSALFFPSFPITPRKSMPPPCPAVDTLIV